LQKFHALPIPQTQQWLNDLLESELFNSVMIKYPGWVD